MLNLTQETTVRMKASLIFIQSQEKNTCITNLMSQLEVDNISAEVIYKVLSKIGTNKLNAICQDQNNLSITFFEKLSHIINLAIRYVSCGKFGYEISIKEAKEAISNDFRMSRFSDVVAKSSTIEIEDNTDGKSCEDIELEGNIVNVYLEQKCEFIPQHLHLSSPFCHENFISAIEGSHNIPKEYLFQSRFMR